MVTTTQDKLEVCITAAQTDPPAKINHRDRGRKGAPAVASLFLARTRRFSCMYPCGIRLLGNEAKYTCKPSAVPTKKKGVVSWSRNGRQRSCAEGLLYTSRGCCPQISTITSSAGWVYEFHVDKSTKGSNSTFEGGLHMGLAVVSRNLGPWASRSTVHGGTRSNCVGKVIHS